MISSLAKNLTKLTAESKTSLRTKNLSNHARKVCLVSSICNQCNCRTSTKACLPNRLRLIKKFKKLKRSLKIKSKVVRRCLSRLTRSSSWTVHLLTLSRASMMRASIRASIYLKTARILNQIKLVIGNIRRSPMHLKVEICQKLFKQKSTFFQAHLTKKIQESK